MDALKEPFSCYLCGSPADRNHHPVFLLQDGEYYWVVTGCKQCVKYRIGVEYASAIEKDPVGFEDRRKFLSLAAQRFARATDAGNDPRSAPKQWLEITNGFVADQIAKGERRLEDQETEKGFDELAEKFLGLLKRLGLLSEREQAELQAQLHSISIEISRGFRKTKRIESIFESWRPVFRDPRVAPAWDQMESFLRTRGIL